MRYPINQWIREGNFFQLSKGGVRHKVIFKNYSTDLVAIKKIIIYDAYSVNVLIFNPSSSFREQLIQIGPRYFGTAFKLTQTGVCELRITKDFLAQLREFVTYLHSLGVSATQQFPDKLVQEMTTIFHFLNRQSGDLDVNDTYQHILPEHPVFSGHVNPNIKNSLLINTVSELIIDNSLFRNKPTQLELSYKKNSAKCQFLLARGADPNELAESGISVLHIVVSTRSINLAKIFLAYGSLPFFPGEGDLDSAAECALRDKNFAMLELFTARLTPLRKSLPVQKMTGFGMLAHQDAVSSFFRFTDGNFLFCSLQHISALTNKERFELYALYDSRFGDEQHNARDALFATEDGKIITLIRDQSTKIKGTVIYTIKMVDDEIWVSIDLELFHAQSANYGMMPVITYIILSLQLLFPDTIIRIVFFSATKASFNRIKEQLAYPKYHTEGMTEQILTALSHFNYQFKFYSDGFSTFYVIEDNPSLIKGDVPPSLNDADEYLYERLRDNAEGTLPSQLGKRRDVLVSLPVAFELLQTLDNISRHRNINVLQIIRAMAENLRATNLPKKILPQLTVSTDKKVMPVFAHSSELFWNKKVQPVNPSAYRELKKGETSRYFKNLL